MKLLLDTHVLLWSTAIPRKLTTTMRRALRDRANEIFVSPLSLFEIALLVRKNRIQLNTQPALWFARAREAGNFREVVLDWEIAEHSTHIDLEHNDPIDRLLAATATAAVRGLTLVTADDKLLRSGSFSHLG